MTTRKSTPDLPRGIESLLSNFPIPERDWEASAKAIQARIASETENGKLGCDDALLEAPLPPEIGEEARTSGINANPRGQSLAELARKSVAKNRAKSDSTAIAKESFSIATRARAESHEIADRISKARDREASQPDAAQLPRAPVIVAQVTEPTPKQKPNNSQFGLFIGAGATVLAFAAAFLIWMRPNSQLELRTATTPSATSAATVKAPDAPGATKPENPHAVANAKPPAPATLNKPSAGVNSPGLAGPSEASSDHAGRSAARPAAAAPIAKSPETKPAQPKAETLPAEPAMSPALGSGTGIPEKPSTGAVQAALGAVMSGARGCVAGQEEPSAADVVFGSDGRVQSVAVSGPAAGTPAAGCIETRLKKARVQPFAATSFSVRATIRPE
jgi:hypothetical protein